MYLPQHSYHPLYMHWARADANQLAMTGHKPWKTRGKCMHTRSHTQ
jgi:hypothetical protein